MFDRWVNIFFLFALVYIFILYGQASDHVRIILALIFALAFSILAFVFNWLTIDGAASAIIFGTIAYGMGGISGASVVLVFFISSSILSKDFSTNDEFLEKRSRRDGLQVWSNGFWFALWTIIWFLTNYDGFMVAAVTSIATAAADTWATEIGANRLKAKARLITTGEKVEPGTDGAISLYGTLAAFAGSLLIAFVFGILNLHSGLSALIIIIVMGFIGCLFDSYLGARFQDNTYSVRSLSIFGFENLYVSNNFVNWISAGVASAISLILILIIGT